MRVSTHLNHLPGSELPLEKLAGSSQISQSEKLAEVSRQFEAILLRQVLSAAQKPVFQSKLVSSSVAGDVYRDLVTNELADQISRSGSLGLTDSLSAQLQNQLNVQSTPPAATTSPSAESLASRRTTSSSHD